MYDDKTRKKIEKHQAQKAKRNTRAKEIKELAKRQPGNIIRTRGIVTAKAAIKRAKARTKKK